MINEQFAKNQDTPSFHRGGIRKTVVLPILFLLLFIAALPLRAFSQPTYPISPDVFTTREVTVRPFDITGADELTVAQVNQYNKKGYSWWQFGGGVHAGPFLPDNATVGTYEATEKLLTFFTMTDVHITDKESPAQAIYTALPPLAGFGNVNTSAYSPIMMSTTHVLDAAIQTINVLHKRTPFDFGIALGDAANASQFNELRWYIDVIDGKRIVPSSGAHLGSQTIDYQKPYQAGGINKSIPWYQVIGNHDQFWCGTLLYDDYARSALVGDTVINMGNRDFNERGMYMGVIDGRTRFGKVIGYGNAETMDPPHVAPDPKRRALATNKSTSLNWMKQFFNTTSKPVGHGFTQDNIDRDFTCYTFEPKASVPLKVISLDDTCKENPYDAYHSYARGCLDEERYQWLVNELEKGQAEGKLMIIAAHVPVAPQQNIPGSFGPPPTTIVKPFLTTCIIDPNSPTCDPLPPYNVVSDDMLLSTLHNYSNVILWVAGHRHLNTITPQPAPPGKGPEFGFWEVETSSLRDFPQNFRTIEIVRNNNNTLSIFATDVDPAVQGNSPATKSRGYAIGAARISVGLPGLSDTTTHSYNAELIKPLAAPYTLTVEVHGPGTVKSSPYSGVDCASDSSCSATYLPGTEVTLVAVPFAGAVFAGWTPCAGTSDCAVKLSSDTAVTALFTRSPTAAVTPAYEDFGNVTIGSSAVATFTIKNTAAKGRAVLTLGAVSLVGGDTSQFNLVAGKDFCSGEALKTGMSCTFDVSFAPTSPFTKTTTISIPSNDPATPTVVQLTGVGK